jgi:peptide/nickel transport system substrate-binding protein
VTRWILWLTLVTGTAACAAGAGRAERRGATVLYASGADLQTVNPLHTVHPLAKQVQRYVLLMTLARYDSALVPQPYLARGWTWSEDRRALRFTLRRTVRWHDGRRTMAQDVAWTLNAARNPEAGYPRLSDLGGIVFVDAPNDTTVVVRFVEPQSAFPDALTDLAILPAHLLDTVPLALLRQAAWNQRPVGNGPFRFVTHEPNRRWVFAANPDFPAELGGPPRLERFIVVVVDEPTTKLAALTAGELDFAGIQPAHAEFVRRDPRLRIIDFPGLLTYGIVFNLRRPPFDDRAVRLAVALALDRREIIDGYLFGFAQVADGLVPPEAPAYVALGPVPTSPDSGRKLLGGRRVAFELLTVGSGEAPLEQMIQARLTAVGFDVTIRQLEMAAFLDRVYGLRREFVAAVLGVPGDLALGQLAAVSQIAGARIPREPAAAQRAFAQTLPIAPLYHARGVVAMNRRVQGVRMDLRGDLPTVAEWWTAP